MSGTASATRLSLLSILFLLALVASGGATVAQDPCTRFTLIDVATPVRLDFTHVRGATELFHMPETLGSGIAWLDYDRDGWLDLYVVQSGFFPPDGGEAAANRLFRNRGDGTFEEVEAAAGAADRGYGMGVVAADVNGDRFADLYVTNYGRDRLYLNDGQGGFRDITDSSGIRADAWSSSAAFGDADGDGDLDLYVVGYVIYDPDDPVVCHDAANDHQDYCSPQLFLGQPDLFYRNLGDGRFRDDTDAVGLGHADGKGLGVLFADFDDDGDADIYVANDTTSNFLFHNRGDGTFDDVSLLSGTAVSREGVPQSGMGVALGDLDGDLDPDLAVTNLDTETNALYMNHGGMVFEERSATNGFGMPSFNLLGFGIVLADLDRDGALDAYIANGNVRRWPSREGITYAQRDLLLIGNGEGDFVEHACGPALHTELVGRGLATADFDNDGDLDLALSNSGGPLQLLRNDSPAGTGRWLGVTLRGRAPNTEAVGARITLETSAGSQVRWVTAGDSYLSTSDKRLLFGIPTDAVVTVLEISWPGGEVTRQDLSSDRLGRYLEFDQPLR